MVFETPRSFQKGFTRPATRNLGFGYSLVLFFEDGSKRASGECVGPTDAAADMFFSGPCFVSRLLLSKVMPP